MQWFIGKNKAQFFSVDVVIAIFIFILILITASVYWDYSWEKINLLEKRANIQLIAKNVLSNLIETEGIPSNWHNLTPINETTVYSIGLAKSFSHNNTLIKNRALGLSSKGAWELDIDKIYTLYNTSTNYTTIKKIIGIPNYDYELKIYIWDGDEYFLSYESGSTPHNATNVVNIERFALLEDDWTRVSLSVWDNEK